MDVYALLDELQTIARNGLFFSTNEFDRERYTRLLKLSTQSYAELLMIPDEKIKKRFLDELGYITPKVGTDAAIFNEHGQILLMQRTDGSGWCLPCGFVEPNESPAEGIVREVREETGLEIRVKQLVGVFTRKPNALIGPHTIISIVHLCEIIGGRLEVSTEGQALDYWFINEMKDWHSAHEIRAIAAHKMWASDHPLPAISG
jgi:ADP-ribose pyrophosphatase YjhB (NUDIX family)